MTKRRKIVITILQVLLAVGIVLVLGAVGDADNGVQITVALPRMFGGGALSMAALLVLNWIG